VVLVTHDRFLFERVTTTVLALDGSGATTPYADYRQWEAARRRRPSAAAESAKPRPEPRAPAAKKRLSYTEQREWEAMEQRILDAEAMLVERQAAANDPAVATRADELAARCRALQETQDEVDRLYARWAELDAKRT